MSKEIMKIYGILFSLLFLLSCTPKVADKTVETAPEVPKTPPTPTTVDPKLSPCKKWTDAPNMEELRTAHVLYRDNIKLIQGLEERGEGESEKAKELYKQAFSNWHKVYSAAPAADGKRADHYQDGIYLYDNLFFQTTDHDRQMVYLDSIKILYNEMADCYGDEGFVYGSMGYDFYYRYEGMMPDQEVYEMYKKSMDAYDGKAEDFVLIPFTSLLVNGVKSKTLDPAEAKSYLNKIQTALKNGLAGCAAKNNCAEWQGTEDNINEFMAILESEKGFFDCSYFKDKYLAAAQSTSDCDELSSLIGRLRWGGCELVDVDVAPLVNKYNGDCVQEDAPAVTCRSILQSGDSQGAVDCYLEKAAASDDPEKRAQYNLVVSKIYYGEIRDFPKARKYALAAAKDKPNWGDPYMLIGKLYASSGPLCGPGRGWDSQIVTWPAIDTWLKAKRIDSSVTADANKLITRYRQYMPSTEDIFIRGLKEGQDFKVPCWIQRTTKIRGAK